MEHDELEREFELAAELLLDAAAWCRFVELGQYLPQQTRRVLARAVTQDPSITKTLFPGGGFNTH